MLPAHKQDDTLTNIIREVGTLVDLYTHRDLLVFSLVVIVVQQQHAALLRERIDVVAKVQHSLKWSLQVLRQPTDHRVLHRYPAQRQF